jgi:hypothetical protein
MANAAGGASMENLDELLTTAEYARERKSSERTIERERTTGTGCKFVKIGRSVRYRRRDILDFIARHVRGSTSELASSSPESIVGPPRATPHSTWLRKHPSPHKGGSKVDRLVRLDRPELSPSSGR